MTSFELGPGVVVDPDSSQLYAMSPDGGIVAVHLGTGDEVWRSRDAAKPLAVAGPLLVSQAEPAGQGNELAIVTLDRRRGGVAVTRSRVELPPGTDAAIDHTANRSFTAHAESLDADATVSWEFVERPLQGIASGPVEVLPGEEAGPDVSTGEEAAAVPGEPEVLVARGAVRLGLADGTVTPIEPPSSESFAEPTVVSPSSAAPDLSTEEQLPDLPGPQFLSADGVHLLTSERVGDESVWEKWRWRILDRRTGEQVGSVRSHVRFEPFFVRGSQVVRLVEPHAHRVGDELLDEPAQVRGVDLSTGEALWSRPVRDITDRDAPPP